MMVDPQILSEAKRRLAETFGPRLQGVVLYGSRARGDARPDSDLDLLVLLEGPIQLGKDLSGIVNALYPLQLRVDWPINAFPATRHAYESGTFRLYRSVKREGVLI